MRRTRNVAVAMSVLGLALLAWTTPVLASPTQAVRVPAEAAGELNRLGLQPLVDLDYGSFRWLELPAAQLDRLVAAGVPFTVVEGAGTVQVLDYRFDPIHDGEPDVLEGVKGQAGAGLRLVQLVAPVRDEWASELDAMGVRLLQYYPHNTYLVWSGRRAGGGGGRTVLRALAGPDRPGDEGRPRTSQLRTGPITNVDVMLYNDGRVDDTLAAVEALGGRVLQHYPSQPDRAFFDAIVELDAAKLADVAALPSVLWLGYQSPQADPRRRDVVPDRGRELHRRRAVRGLPALARPTSASTARA